MSVRVLYVVRVFPKLSETFIATEMAELRRRGVEIRILSLRSPSEELRHAVVTRAGLADLTVYDPGEFPVVLRKFRPQLLHAHFATSATAKARELAAEGGIPFTFTAHRYDIYDKPPRDFADRAATAAAIITVSDANLHHIAKTFGVPPSRIHVIPCGVDTDRFRPSSRRAAPSRIVCVARLVPFKRVDLLLAACALLQARGVEFRCTIVGDGRSRHEIEAQRARLRLEQTVELVGAAEQARVRAWWRRATVAALASDSEGMPVSLMEAAACGVPAVATAVGGIPELIEDGVTGILTPPGDAGKLAAALERLLRDPELATRFGVAARRRAEEHFSVTRQVDRLLHLWTGLVGSGAR